MPIAAFDPGQQMAAANFSLALLCIFTIGLPLLLVTRGDKTQANREFLNATINPWVQTDPTIAFTPIIQEESCKIDYEVSDLEVVDNPNLIETSDSNNRNALESTDTEVSLETSPAVLITNEEPMAA